MHVNPHFLNYVLATVSAYCLFNVRVTFFHSASVLSCREIMRNGGGRMMSTGVNTKTCVWQGTMIRFIKQPQLFSLFRDCWKTLGANWCSQRSTTETLLPPSPYLFPNRPFLCALIIPPYLSHISFTLSSSPLGEIRFTPLCPTKMGWL